MVLSHDICALMRRCRPQVEPSQYRVTAILLTHLPPIIAALGTRHLATILDAFIAALWREGVNPNPGRPYKATEYAWDFESCASTDHPCRSSILTAQHAYPIT
jgi:hypothetical protein